MLNYNVYPIFPTPMYQAMVDQQIFDNIHPSWAGYKEIAEASK